MASPLADRDLRGHLNAFLTHELSADAFHDWFAGALWDIEQSAPDADFSLAATIENRLAEYTGGYISEEALRDVLREDTQATLTISDYGHVPA